MKLQKLVYYSQAWSLVWDDRPLFHERIEAWANGPVVPVLYNRHRQQYQVDPGTVEGDPSQLDEAGRDTVDAVLKALGHRSSQYLSDLTHRESPWTDVRVGLKQRERGDKEITHAAMAEYYSSFKDEDAVEI